jgi:hypothetical protein
MVAITCPWCEDEGLLAYTELELPETTFTCAECGTTVDFVDEPGETLDLAA